MPTSSLGPLTGASRLDSTLVRDIMRPGVVTVAQTASLLQVHRAIAGHGIHAVLVVDEHDGLPLGWVTARRALELADRDPHLTAAGSAVTEPPVTVSPSATARKARELLLETGTTHLLVCHGAPGGAGGTEGVVSDPDVVALLGGRR
jgi:CBS domain-containing protein